MRTLFEQQMNMYQPDMLAWQGYRAEILDWVKTVNEQINAGGGLDDRQEVRNRYLVRLEDGSEKWIWAVIFYYVDTIKQERVPFKKVKLKYGGAGDTIVPTQLIDVHDLRYFHDNLEETIGNNDIVNIPTDLMQDILGFFRKYAGNMIDPVTVDEMGKVNENII